MPIRGKPCRAGLSLIAPQTPRQSPGPSGRAWQWRAAGRKAAHWAEAWEPNPRLLNAALEAQSYSCAVCAPRPYGNHASFIKLRAGHAGHMTPPPRSPLQWVCSPVNPLASRGSPEGTREKHPRGDGRDGEKTLTVAPHRTCDTWGKTPCEGSGSDHCAMCFL